MRSFVFIIALTVSIVCEARMYQWINPNTGSVQLSGTPPAWYRAGDGPRVRVFDDGNLVDDTAIELPRLHNDELRETAFKEFAERRQLEALRKLERAAEREERRSQREAVRLAEEQRVKEVTAEGETNASADLTPETLGPQTIERLKRIISEWDRTTERVTDTPYDSPQ